MSQAAKITPLVFVAFLIAPMICPVYASQAQQSMMAVANGGFELSGEDGIPGWRWWTREPDVGSASLTREDVHSGDYAVFITHHGERDLAFSNASRFAVSQGQKLTASAWVKCQETEDFRLAAVALKNGETVRWDIGSDGVWGTQDWTLLTALIQVRERWMRSTCVSSAAVTCGRGQMMSR